MAQRFSHTVRAVSTVAVAGLVLALGGPACSAGGEGDRCTFFNSPSNSIDPQDINGTDECQDGLVCWSQNNFNVAITGAYDRCCPPNLADSTVLACQMVGTLDGGNPTSGRDAGTDGAVDGAKDGTSSESSSDSSSDVSSKDAPTKG